MSWNNGLVILQWPLRPGPGHAGFYSSVPDEKPSYQLAFHTLQKLKKTKFYLSFKLRFLRKCPPFQQHAHTQDTIPLASHETVARKEAPTTSFFQLREALLTN